MDKIEKIRNPYLTEDEKMDIIADILEQGTGGKVIPINVTLSPEQSGYGIDVIADKTTDDVKSIIESGNEAVVRLVVDEEFEGFSPGVYEIPLVYVSEYNVLASTVIGIEYQKYYVYSQGRGTYNAKIAVESTHE